MMDVLARLNEYGEFFLEIEEVRTVHDQMVCLCCLIQVREEGDEQIFFGTEEEIDAFIKGMLYAIERSELI